MASSAVSSASAVPLSVLAHGGGSAGPALPSPASASVPGAVDGQSSAAAVAVGDAKGGAGGSARPAAASTRRALDAVERRKAEQVEAEVVRAQSLASLRWSDCLQCLSSSLPLLADNPYLCILQPPFLYDYLDSLTETLANLHSHSSDLPVVRALLQAVYQSFIDLGKFAKYQPAFYFDDPHSLRRFMRLLEQVSHKSSDKALYPNILSLLTPTFQRPSLYPLLAELGLLRCLIAFAVNGWIPSTPTSLMLFAILEEMTADEGMRRSLQAEAGWERLCKLSWGREAGLSVEQQSRGQQALAWAEPELPDDWKVPATDTAEDGEEEEEEEEGEEEGEEDDSRRAQQSQPHSSDRQLPMAEQEGQAQEPAAAAPPPLGVVALADAVV